MEPGIPDEKIDKTVYKQLQQKIVDQPLEYTRLYITRDTKLNSILYYFLADAIVTRFGDDGRRVVRNAVREIGRRRETELRQKFNAVETWIQTGETYLKISIWLLSMSGTYKY